MTSGVPRGSVLSPLLFLTYINDLPNGLTSTVKLFADDTLFYEVVVEDSDSDNLRDDLNKLEIWQLEWQLQFNPSKCSIICIQISPPQRTYFFCGSKLEQVDAASYIGITFNSKLKWSDHTHLSQARRVDPGGWSREISGTAPGKYVKRPISALSDPNWSKQVPQGTHTTKKIFQPWREFKEKLLVFFLQNFNKTASVTDMLSDLKWDTLETGRKKNKLTLMYKLSHNLVDINTEHLIPNKENRTRKSHVFKYKMPKVSKDVFKFSFFPRSITEWNSLPADLVNCKSLSDFKLNSGKYLK